MAETKREMDPLSVRYSFKLPNRRAFGFLVRLNENSLALMRKKGARRPAWTRLENHQCPNCPLDPKKTPYCPAATALAPILDRFRDTSSLEQAKTTIRTATRVFQKVGPISTGLGALVGLCMASCGCPVLDKLRPLTRTHLPFATHEETMYRVLSMYMLAQFFQMTNGGDPDWKMERLRGLIKDIRVVNKSFCARISEARHTGDAGMNAVVLLDCFAAIIGHALERKNLALIERTFRAYLDCPPLRSPPGGGTLEKS